MRRDLRRGLVVWADLNLTRGREQSRRTPVLVIASDQYLRQADTLAIVLPCTTVNRGWPNHVPLRGTELKLSTQTFAMTEQPRTITRDRLSEVAGLVSTQTMDEVDLWLGDFLGITVN